MVKARTKAQRRGRPRKSGPREPNGQPQRDTVAQTKATAVQARMRQHGLSLVDAGERLAGYEIGRMYLRHEIDLVDVEVVDDYVEVVARFMALTVPSQPFPRAIDYAATVRGLGGDVSPEQAIRIRKRYADWSEVVASCSSMARLHFHEAAFWDRRLAGSLPGIRECIKALRAKFR